MANVSEQIKAICVNYAAFMIECSMNEQLKEAFKKDPKPYLNNQIGMRIPYDDNVKVVLDDKRWRWPIALAKVNYKGQEERFVIEEGKLEIEMKGDKYYNEIQKYLEAEEQKRALPYSFVEDEKEYNITIKDPKDTGEYKFEESTAIKAEIKGMKVNDIVVILPFFDVATDLLGTIEYNEGSEIVLTSCC